MPRIYGLLYPPADRVHIWLNASPVNCSDIGRKIRPVYINLTRRSELGYVSGMALPLPRGRVLLDPPPTPLTPGRELGSLLGCSYKLYGVLSLRLAWHTCSLVIAFGRASNFYGTITSIGPAIFR